MAQQFILGQKYYIAGVQYGENVYDYKGTYDGTEQQGEDVFHVFKDIVNLDPELDYQAIRKFKHSELDQYRFVPVPVQQGGTRRHRRSRSRKIRRTRRSKH